MMRRIAFAIAASKALVIAIFVLQAMAPARAQDLARTNAGNDLAGLSGRFDSVLDAPRFVAASWGIRVVSLDSGTTLYQRNADKLLVPASTAKLFTAAAALDTFGADYRIPTVVLSSARPARDGGLRGDLVLYGYGDPSLGIDQRADWAHVLAKQLRDAGLREVKGNLIADATRFAAPLHGRGWDAGDLQHGFGAPASALSVDDNTVRLTIQPGLHAGNLARLHFQPETSAPQLDNRLRTVPARAAGDISLIRRPGDTTLYAFGAIAADAGEQNYRLALNDPALVAAIQLRQALADVGIGVRGKLRSVYWPAIGSTEDGEEWIKLAEDYSPPLSELVRRGLKISHNAYMQNLLLMLGANDADLRLAEQVEGARPLAFRSSERRGIDVLSRYVARLGIAAEHVNMEEGAGLSRRDLLTASALTRLLVAHGSGDQYLAFRLALPEAGVDGTLLGRMRNSAAAGRVFAKTGSMSMIWSLAGYATTAAGERLAFAFLLNHYQPSADGNDRASRELDNLAILLAQLSERSDQQLPPPTPSATPNSR